MAATRFYLDEMPGETRGIVVSDDHIHSLYIQRDTDRPEHRLKSRSVGRIARVEPGLRAAFVDLGCGEPFGFLPLGKAHLTEGEKILVEVSAEPRESKGPALKRIGEAAGDVGLVKAGPSVRQIITALADGQPIMTGLEAVNLSIEAEEDARTDHVVRPESGLDLSIQRTRALIAVDIDYAPLPGKDSRKGREQVNRHGLVEAARQLRLRHWAGTVVIDLAGVGFVGEGIVNAARTAFEGFEQVSFGPLSKFGLLQLALPWRYQPLDERFADPVARPLAALRQLNRTLLEDTATPFYELVCGTGQERMLAPLVARLGPRARLVVDGAAERYLIREG